MKNLTRSKSFNYVVLLKALMLFTIAQFPTVNSHAQNGSLLRVVFYNLENFFDVFEDSTRSYNAFTPEGEQRWSYHRYKLKRNNIFKTIAALGKGELPAIVGLCEVENEFVVRDIILKTPLKSGNYEVVHYESADRRGIDVALIYRKDYLKLFTSQVIRLVDTADPGFLTRDILFSGFIVNDDTLYTYVNHWPSRYGGQMETIPKRRLAAQTLRKHIDSLLSVQQNAKIIIMGDFNDSPTDESITKWLNAHTLEHQNETSLVHLFTDPRKLGHEGTLKHQHSWQIFDHIIISSALMNATKGIHYKDQSATIFKAPFLLMDDERHLGQKLNRTYTGPTYIGGYSDHLPVYIDLLTTE